MLSSFFHLVFYQPLYNGLVFLTDILPFHDFGFSVIILTLVVKFILFPLSHGSIITQKKIKFLEPEINKIKKECKNKKEEQARKTMELYRKHGISPFSGVLMLFIQLPIFIALYMVLKGGVVLKQDILYSFVFIPEYINTVFLGFIDLSKSSYILSFLAAFSQFFQIKLAMPAIKDNKEQAKNQKPTFKTELQKSMGIQMRYIMPIFIFFIAQRFSSGLALYWTVSNIFAIFHEIVVSRKVKDLPVETKEN